MIYKPMCGYMKDGAMIYNDGKYYLFSMYRKEGSEEYRNVWLAISEDGVHFKDYGCVVDNFDSFIWAMKLYRIDDEFYMNSGSFCPNGRQGVLKFWHSRNLVNWEYLPDSDIVSPDIDDKKIRLDCMNVVRKNEKYYGYATGQYGFLRSDDGKNWTMYPANIDYYPFPPYNPALGGFEIADCVCIDDIFYLFCGGFGHLGTDGYGVFLYESRNPLGPFKPCLPYYRINGTSKRWVNVWERFFEKDGEYFAHNYCYDGYTMEKGNVYLPPIKRLMKDEQKLYLAWWEKNNLLYGALYGERQSLRAKAPSKNMWDESTNECFLSERVELPAEAILEFDLILSENTFVDYSRGGFFLGEENECGSAVIFDTNGRCDIAYIKNGVVEVIEDTITFGSCAPYYFEAGRKYHLRVLLRNGLFEIYVDDKYLQTFNNAHFPDSTATHFEYFSALSCKRESIVENIKVYEMN